jgi:hypothetical protein
MPFVPLLLLPRQRRTADSVSWLGFSSTPGSFKISDSTSLSHLRPSARSHRALSSCRRRLRVATTTPLSTTPLLLLEGEMSRTDPPHSDHIRASGGRLTVADDRVRLRRLPTRADSGASSRVVRWSAWFCTPLLMTKVKPDLVRLGTGHHAPGWASEGSPFKVPSFAIWPIAAQ